MKKMLMIIGTLLLAVAASAAFGSDHAIAYHLASFSQPEHLYGLLPGLGAIGMTTLAADQPRDYFFGEFEEFPMIAADIIYKGAAVGDNGAGYARPLVAGDPFRGFAELQVDNSSGAAGDVYVRCRSKGSIKLTIAALAITDVGKDVYASDDNTFTLTQGTNTRIGHVKRWVSSGVGVVEFDATHGVVTELTDNSGGAATDTIAAITDAPTKDAVASLAAKVNYLIRRQGN